jgi:hypothetical protein
MTRTVITLNANLIMETVIAKLYITDAGPQLTHLVWSGEL